MKRFPFLRKPTKLILSAALLLLTTTAALVFSLQYMLDGLVMDHSMNSAAYVGTVYSRVQEMPMLQPLPDELVAQLSASEYVADLSIRQTHSGRIEGAVNVRDGFGINASLNKQLFVEGIVAQTPQLSPTNLGVNEVFQLNILKLWGGSWDGETVQVILNRGYDAQTPKLKQGDRVFIVGRYNAPADGLVTGIYLVDQADLEPLGVDLRSVLWENALMVLPDDAEDSEAYIERYMAQTGLDSCCAVSNTLFDVFTVYAVDDMSMLLTIADATTFITEGRALQQSDIGSKVCVVNQALADRNGWRIGDTVALSLTDGCYTSTAEATSYDGWENGYPYENDILLDYVEQGDYEIVGLYSEINRAVGRVDLSHHSRNDIFIPTGTTEGFTTAPTARPRALTFRVLGPDYESFMDQFEVSLNEQGYTLNIVDTGWEDVSSGFYAMADRRALMLGCAILAFLAAVVSFDFLLLSHFRYEFALRRLLGAYPAEARGIFVSGFLFTALPAGMLSVAGACAVYALWLKDQVSATLPIVLPTQAECIAMLAVWVLAELIAAFIVLMVLSLWAQKRSLLKLIK